MSKDELEKFDKMLSPSLILGIYANAVNTSHDKKVILVKGVYHQVHNKKEYGGYFYDELRSEFDNKSIRLKMPVLLRSKLDNNKVYVFKAYIEKSIKSSTIELILVVDDMLKKEEKSISDEDLKRFDLLQNKITKGYRDFEALVKESYFNGTKLKIANIYGNIAIVDKDFEMGLSDSVVRFELSKHRCNLNSKTDIIKTIENLQGHDYDVIALVRGGGDSASLEIFNDPELGFAVMKLQAVFVTALGHTVDETLLDKVADRKFHLPHDYGNKLKEWVNQASEEQAKSKSIFIEQAKKDLEKTFNDQIATLKTQLENKNKEFETSQTKFNEIIEQNNKDKNELIQAKEKLMESTVKSLNEQIKAKEDNIKAIQESNEINSKLQIETAIAQYKAINEMSSKENILLTQKLEKEVKSKKQLVLYILLAAIIGLLFGMMI